MVEVGVGDVIMVNLFEVYDGIFIGDVGCVWCMFYFDFGVVVELVMDLYFSYCGDVEFDCLVIYDVDFVLCMCLLFV